MEYVYWAAINMICGIYYMEGLERKSSEKWYLSWFQLEQS